MVSLPPTFLSTPPYRVRARLRNVEHTSFRPSDRHSREIGCLRKISSFSSSALSSLIANTAFLGDLLLYFPDESQPLLKKNSEWNQLFKWSLDFCRESQHSDQATKKLMYLVSKC